MTWTYTDPSTSTRDAVRFLIGDTDTNDQLVTDAEIAFITTEYTDKYLAAAELCEAIAAKLARDVDTTNGDLRVAAQKRFEHYNTLAKKYRSKGGKLATMWAGGRLLSEKETAADDTTITQPSFTRGMHDFPGNDESIDRLSTQGY